MKKLLNNPFIVIGAPLIIGCLFYFIYSEDNKEWEYTLGTVFWIVALLSLFVAVFIYKWINRNKW